jgi:hypothetical protein
MDPSAVGAASNVGGNRVSWHHNLFAHNLGRNPRFQGAVDADFRNNVIYDWGETAGYPGRPSRNSKGVSLFDRGSLLPPAVAIDDRKHFVCALCRITAHIVIGNLHVDASVPRHAA